MTADSGRVVGADVLSTGRLASVCDRVRYAAVSAGLSAQRANDLVTAVNELAINTIQHANGTGRLILIRLSDGLRVDVGDSGPGLATDVGCIGSPSVHTTGGRGLWIVRHLFPDMTITSDTSGAVVTIIAPRYSDPALCV